MRKLSQKEIQANCNRAKKSGKSLKLVEGHLQIKVLASGKVGFFYRSQRDGKDRLCKLPVTTLADARKHVLEWEALDRAGQDPIEEHARRKRDEQARKAAEVARVKVCAYFRTYEKAHLDHLKSATERTRIFEKYILPHLGEMYLADVQRSHVMPIIDAKKAEGKGIQANRIYSALSHFFNFAHARGVIEHSPLGGFSFRVIGSKENPRERVLTLDELRAFIQFLHSSATKISPQMRGIFRMLILTGQRLSEVRLMKWTDINDDLWRLPETKNGTAHVVPLPPPALDVISSLRPLTGSQRFVFGREAPTGEEAPTDAPMVVTAPSKALRRLYAAGELPGEPFTPHDLRRTVATYLVESCGVTPHLVETILNHTPPRIVRTYQKASLLPEIRKALNTWAVFLTKLTADNVIPFDAKKNLLPTSP